MLGSNRPPLNIQLLEEIRDLLKELVEQGKEKGKPTTPPKGKTAKK